MNPIITHKKRDIDEIIKLRELSWIKVYGEGWQYKNWTDSLDLIEKTNHWIVKDKDKIIAASRLSILTNKEEIPYCGIFKDIDLEDYNRIGFYSRLVVHPDYQGQGLSQILDKVRLEQIKTMEIKITLATARNWRINKLSRMGWTILNPVNGKDDSNWNLGEATILIYQNV